MYHPRKYGQDAPDRKLILVLAVANEQGSFTTPSFVSFTEEERLIGEAAKNQAAMNPANTVFDVKSVPLLQHQHLHC